MYSWLDDTWGIMFGLGHQILRRAWTNWSVLRDELRWRKFQKLFDVRRG